MSRKAGNGEEITAERIRHLAKLSRLSLSPQEERRIGPQLSEIVDYFRLIDKANLAKASQIVESATRANAFREDVLEICDSDPILKLAPRKKGRLVKAPRVF